MICRKAIALVLPPATYIIKNAVVVCGGKDFLAKSKSLKDKGWKILFDIKNDDDDNSKELPNLSIGQALGGKEYGVRTVTVEPPHRYTLGGLVEAMERAGQNIDDDALAEEMITNHKSLGTGATRDTIIDDLLNYKYISVNGKSVYATQIGEWIIDNFPVKELTDVVFTAEMEHKLFLVQKGELDYKQYCSEMQNNVRMWCERFAAASCKPMNISSTGGLKCPSCGKNIITMNGKNNAVYWACEDWRQVVTLDSGEQSRKCEFILPNVFRGAKLTLKDVECLCGGKSTPFHTFKTKEGKEYKGCLKYDVSNHSVMVSSEIERLICPECGGSVKVTSYGYVCSNHVDTGEKNERGYKIYKCPFSVGAEIMTAKITLTDVKQICKGVATATKKFFKDDKEFYGVLSWNKESKKINISYSLNGVACPLCGGNIKIAEKNWHCINNEVPVKDESGNVIRDEKGYPKKQCSFSIPKVLWGASLRESDLRNLCDGKQTRKIEFVNKEGNPYSAVLLYNKATQRIDRNYEGAKYICPICKKGDIRHSKDEGKGWYCSSYKDGCGFRFPDTFFEVSFSEKDIASISKTGYSEKHKRINKDGKEYSARFYWNVKDKKLGMIFPKSKK